MAPPSSSPDPIPGTVWWCDGVSLAFDPYYKRRPVLVVAEEEDNLLAVIPLSSKRRYGQETEVTHDKGSSYMTGTVLRVEKSALAKSLGIWEGFSAWYTDQQAGTEDSSLGFFQRFFLWLLRLIRLDRPV